ASVSTLLSLHDALPISAALRLRCLPARGVLARAAARARRRQAGVVAGQDRACRALRRPRPARTRRLAAAAAGDRARAAGLRRRRSEEHTSELQSRENLV